MKPPRHIVWSTDRIDLNDSVQRRWYIRQVLLHGRAEDIRTLDLAEVAALLDDLNLFPNLSAGCGGRFWRGRGIYPQFPEPEVNHAPPAGSGKTPRGHSPGRSGRVVA